VGSGEFSKCVFVEINVLRTPLKPMHLSPISRINSAIATPSLCGLDALVELYSAIIDSGEFIVIVAAVDMPSHDGRPSFRSVASSWIL
jgi:hypothetical protein